MSSLRTGRLERVVDPDGYGRLMLVDSDGDSYRITRALLREAGIRWPTLGAEVQFNLSSGGAVRLLGAA